MKSILFKKEKVKLYKDGDMWCCMTGSNLQEGVAGFGKTKGVAIANFGNEKGYDFIQQYAIRELFGFKMI